VTINKSKITAIQFQVLIKFCNFVRYLGLGTFLLILEALYFLLPSVQRKDYDLEDIFGVIHFWVLFVCLKEEWLVYVR
jgi:hypothetical protein